MKKILSALLVITLLLGLCACGNTQQNPETTVETLPPVDATATDADKAKLDSLYAGREIRYGEMHAHADTGGKSDGKYTLDQWKETLRMNGMDFATIVDHKQTLHMTLPQWDNNVFVGGSEAGGNVLGSPAKNNMIHYNMLFSNLEDFETILNMYPLEFQYFGDFFVYPKWNVEKLNQLSRDIYANGGLFVHVHPQASEDYMVSDDPADYFFGDVMGFEVFTGYRGDMSYGPNKTQYETWTKLLALGKRAYATCGSDAHGSLTHISRCPGMIYAENTEAKTLLNYIRSGNFVAGPAAIRMAVGDTQMGGEGSFAGNRLVISAGKIHYMTYDPTHTYRLDVYDDQGLVFSEPISGDELAYFAIDADPNAKYYHANVYDVTDDKITAIGNPIWNQ